MEFTSRFLTDKDKEKISLAVQLHTPLEIMSYTLPREKEVYIQEVLMYFLKQCHQEHMTDNLVFCLSELLTNSKKANTKRVYFTEQKLDINNEMDYHQLEQSFLLYPSSTFLPSGSNHSCQKKPSLLPRHSVLNYSLPFFSIKILNPMQK